MTWTVYELYNEVRRELFVGITDKDLDTELDLNRSMPPDSIRHWNFEGEKVSCKSHHAGLSRHEAREAVRVYKTKPGWVLRRTL